MKQRHDRFKVALVCLFLLVLPLFSMYYHGRLDRPQSLMETSLINATAPGQSVMNAIFSSVVTAWKGYVYLVEVEEQNGMLRSELDKLKLIASRTRGLEEENRRLQALLEFRQEHQELVLKSARIIARETSPFFSVSRIRLDRGSEDVVRPNMPVVTASGVVGRIEKVAGDYGDVMLLTDTRSRIDVQIPGKGFSGTLVGMGDSLPAFRYPYMKTMPVKGDLLITTGHDRLFPKGLVAGYVASDSPRQVGTQLEVKVEPGVRLSALQEVFIILSQPEAPDPARNFMGGSK
jgi:rod shape-determining protein MreC